MEIFDQRCTLVRAHVGFIQSGASYPTSKSCRSFAARNTFQAVWVRLEKARRMDLETAAVAVELVEEADCGRETLAVDHEAVAAGVVIQQGDCLLRFSKLLTRSHLGIFGPFSPFRSIFDAVELPPSIPWQSLFATHPSNCFTGTIKD